MPIFVQLYGQYKKPHKAHIYIDSIETKYESIQLNPELGDVNHLLLMIFKAIMTNMWSSLGNITSYAYSHALISTLSMISKLEQDDAIYDAIVRTEPYSIDDWNRNKEIYNHMFNGQELAFSSNIRSNFFETFIEYITSGTMVVDDVILTYEPVRGGQSTWIHIVYKGVNIVVNCYEWCQCCTLPFGVNGSLGMGYKAVVYNLDDTTVKPYKFETDTIYDCHNNEIKQKAVDIFIDSIEKVI